MAKCYTFIFMFCACIVFANAQTPVGPAEREEPTIAASLKPASVLPERYLKEVTAKAARAEKRMDKSTGKAVRRLQRQEAKIQKKLSKVDSVVAKNLMKGDKELRSFKSGLDKWKEKVKPVSGYSSYLDTLKNALSFFETGRDSLLNFAGRGQQSMEIARTSVTRAESQMQQVEQIGDYMQDRLQLLQGMSSYSKGLQKHLDKMGKTFNTYQAQVQHYKELWQQPDKLEAEVLSRLHQLPAFEAFMKKNSALAALFNVPQSSASSLGDNLRGLQTREMVQQELQSQLSSGAAGGMEGIRQRLSEGEEKLRDLQKKILGTRDLKEGTFGSSGAEMPSYKSENLSSRTLFERLEFGGNVQFNNGTSILDEIGDSRPIVSDLAGEIAYMFSTKGSAGVGAAFKLGWGKSLQKIHFSAQGVGLRSFIDYKLKGTFYLNGGFEWNYNKFTINSSEPEKMKNWGKSALLGISKKYKISGNLKGKLMLLYDFMYRREGGSGSPLVLRVGYNFR